MTMDRRNIPAADCKIFRKASIYVDSLLDKVIRFVEQKTTVSESRNTMTLNS